MFNENEKNLETVETESRYVDEFESSSTSIVSENDTESNEESDTYDFPTEEKPKVLTPMQQKRLASGVALNDSEPYFAKIARVSHYYYENKKGGAVTIHCNVDALDNGEYSKEIEMKLHFDEQNTASYDVNWNILENILKKFKLELDDEDYEDVSSISRAMQEIVGSEITIKQKTKGEYKNYTIVKVL